MDYLFSFIISALISAIIIPVFIRSATRLNLMDSPGERKIHSTAIPRSGGIGLSIGALAACFYFLPFDNSYIALMSGSVVIILFGLLDDVKDINFKWKFFGQILAVLIVTWNGIYFQSIPFIGEVPTFVGYLLTIVFVIGVTNAVNLSDGLDGLAAGIMLISLGCIAILALQAGSKDIVLISLAVAGGIIGFLRYNVHPAIVFMGDTGSQFIGFMAAFLTVILTQNVANNLNPALPLFLLGLPILDTVSVMAQRIHHGHSPFSADKRHIHHKLLDFGFSHTEAVSIIYLIHIVFLVSAYFLRFQSDWIVVGLYVLLCSLVLFLFYLASITHWRLHSKQELDKRRKVRAEQKNKDWKFTFVRLLIEYSVILYLGSLTSIILYVLSVNILILEILFLFVAFSICKWTSKGVQDFVVQVGVFISIVYSTNVIAIVPGLEVLLIGKIELFFALLLLAILWAVRITRKSYFRLTTQDLLIILLVVVAMLLIQSDKLTRIIFYLFCMAYALEYLFHRDIYSFRILRVVALMCFQNIILFQLIVY